MSPTATTERGGMLSGREQRVQGSAWLAVCAVTALAMAACGTNQEDMATSAAGSASRFAALFDGYSADYEPAPTPDILSEWSDLVVRGTILRVERGRLFGQSEEDPTATRSIVMVIGVAAILSGTLPAGADGLAYIELPAPGGTAADVFDRYAPKTSQVVLYLVPAATAAQTPIADPDTGRPVGQPLFQPTNPQGFVVEDDKGVLQPLDFAEFPGASLQQFVPASEQFPVDPGALSED